MTEQAVALDSSVVVVRVGASTAAYVPSTRELLELSAGAVAVLERLAAGLDPVRGGDDAELVDQLQRLGVLRPSPDGAGGPTPTRATGGPVR